MLSERTPKKFLVVDDSAVERTLLRGLLKQYWPSCQIAEASDGDEALLQVENQSPDIVLTDLCMPKSSGLDLVAALRDANQHVPVVVMTGFGNEETAVAALQAGAASYVPKSKLSQWLVSTVDTVTELGQTHRNRRRVSSSLTWMDMRFEIENDGTLVSPLVRYLQDQIGSMRLVPEHELVRIGVALHESLSNAIHHGNLELDSELRQEDESIYYELAATRRIQWPYCDRKVHVHASLNSDRVRFVIRDQGPGFNQASVQDATEDDNLLRVGGRGLLLIRSFMDEAFHNGRGNEISLTKYTSPAKALLAHKSREAETEASRAFKARCAQSHFAMTSEAALA